MSHTITVGLHPTSHLEEVKEAIINQFHSADYNLEFQVFDSYTTHKNLPDVFVTDSLFLPELVKQGHIIELSNTTGEEVFSFAADGARVDGKNYAYPQLVSSYFVFSASSTKDAATSAKSIYDLSNLAQKGSVRLVYPKVAEDYNVVFHYINATSRNALPTNASEVSKDFTAKYKKVIDATQVETVAEFFNNTDGAVLVGYSQYVSGHNVDDLHVQILQDENGQKNYFVDVVVVSSSVPEWKRNAAIQLARVIASGDVLIAAAEKSKPYYLPASKKALQSLSQKDPLFKQLYNIVNDESNAQSFRLSIATNDHAMRHTAKLIKPYIQHTTVAAMRCLAGDIVERANSGHPGMPIGMSPTAYVLWKYFINVAPKDSKWMNRDRFVLSNGHGCVLQYILLHLTGFKISMDDLKSFRQIDSVTPGHPEYMHTDGVEATTGPLGQGIANCVGMAIAEQHLAARFNEPDNKLLDHFVYVFCGDGCLMEGVGLEALSLAGHLKLGNLILFYDDNNISIDGSTSLTFTDDIPTVASGFGWHVQRVRDGDSDLVSLKEAIINARNVTDRPSIICIKTTIGYSTKKQGTGSVHGSPLGLDALKGLKEIVGFNPDETFVISEHVRKEFALVGERGNQKLAEWKENFEKYAQKYPEKAQKFVNFVHKRLPDNWDKCLPDFTKQKPELATRQCSALILNAIAPVIENLVGGSADLTPSTLTFLDVSKDFQPDSRDGRYFRFGVREHSMIAVGNGILYYGGLIPFVSTFLVFAEYGLGALRLSALSHLPLIFVFTHDSIGLGEDGPTHQPVEVLSILRSIPNLVLFRPADGTETNAAYKYAIESTKTPTALALTRQGVKLLPTSSVEKALKGAYVVFQNNQFDTPELIIVASGSEVGIAIEGAKKLNDIKVNVVSMPSWELFEQQSMEYKKSIFIPNVPVLSVEAAGMQGWDRYAHSHIGMKTFGASGPYKDVYKKFGITDAHIAERARKMVKVYNSSNPAPPLPVNTPAFD
jgi:transketolase